MITKLVTGIRLSNGLEEQMKARRITLRIVCLVDGVIYPPSTVHFFISLLCTYTTRFGQRSHNLCVIIKINRQNYFDGISTVT